MVHVGCKFLYIGYQIDLDRYIYRLELIPNVLPSFLFFFSVRHWYCSRMGWTHLPTRLAPGQHHLRLVPRAPTRASCPALCAALTSHHPHLTPRAALHHTSRCLSPRLALRTAGVRPPRHGIELYAGVKLRVNEHPLGRSK
jgi:hypothetical protein